MRVLFALCGLLLCAPVVHGGAASPVQKVVELLENLKGKVASDLANEEQEMAEYSKFCDTESSEKAYAIDTAAKAIERLSASVEESDAQIAGQDTEIASLSAEAAKKETELAKAVNLRKTERAEFKKTESGLVQAEDELQRAEVVIKKEMAFVQTSKKGGPQKFSKKSMEVIASALSKVMDAATISSQSKSVLKGFLQAQSQDGEEDKDLQMPTAKATEDHSGGVLDTVKDLEVKDQDQISAVRKSEMEGQHAFDMMKMSMEDSINLLKKKISKATSKKAEYQEKNGAAKGEAAETQKNKAADEEYLSTLKTECSAAATNWDERQKSAAEEMGAIDKAKEILQNGVQAFAQTHTPDDDDASEDKDDSARLKLQQILKDMGHKFNSYVMMEMASAAATDPFAKVKGLIEDMIAKLMDAAAEEADHKAFCDEELGKSNKAKDTKSGKMDEYRTRIDEDATTKAEMSESVKELQAELAEIDASTAEATKIRNEEKNNNLKAASDFRQSAEAVEKATAVLKEYYGKALFIQVSQKTAKAGQPSFGSKTGSDTASTILSILEVSAADFTKLLAEVEAEEDEAISKYQKLMQENRVAKAAKLAEVKGKQSEIKSLAVALTHSNEDYKSVSKEYDAVVAYLDKLRPECETKVMSYAEKKARREQEIDGLKEALGIIEGTAVAPVEFVQVKKHA